jgi:subtilisin-like proprotein convertase family protein
MRLKLLFVLFGVLALSLVHQQAFAQPCAPLTFTNSTALAIPDNSTRTTTIVVSGAPNVIMDLDVVTFLTHTWNADMDIILTSPAGTAVSLTTDNGGSNDNVFNGTVWTDNAGATNSPGAITEVTFANGVVETPLAPEEGLAAFNGENPNGTWTLTLIDQATGDPGNLSQWSLVILARPALTTATGTYASTSATTVPSNATVTNSITVSGAGSQIVDVNILTNLTHTWNNDVRITLTSPAGTVITMTSFQGGSNDNIFNGTIWDDRAGSTNAPGAITDATFANNVVETPICPREPLGAFNGENPNGTWTISIQDNATGDEGNLSSWSLTILTLVDNQLPVVNTHPLSAAVCANENVTFSGTATNSTGYQWQISVGGGAYSDIPGANTATLTLNAVTASMSGNRYRLVVYGVCSQSISNPATLTVYALPSLGSVTANPKAKIHPGQLTSLEVSFNGMPGTFSWYRNNTLVQTTIGPSITNLNVDSLGAYRVQLRDVNGCLSESRTITLSADPNWEFYVYPTPTTNGQFQVRFYSYTLGGKRTLNVFDSKGNLVYKREFTVNNPYERMDVDVAKYTPGVYLVELRDGNGDLLGTGSTLYLK